LSSVEADASQTVPEEDLGEGAPSQRWPYWLPIGVLVTGLLVTAALAVVALVLYQRDERRLLDLRVRDAGTLLATSLTSIQTPLASAAELADATNGDVRKFERFVAPYTGFGTAHRFVSFSLWRLDAIQQGPVAVVGLQPILAASPDASVFFAHAARMASLSVIGMLHTGSPRVGYAYTTSGAGDKFVAYGESAVPANRRSRFESNTAFSDLNYAIYLGPWVLAPNLLVTDLTDLPIQGQHAKEVIPFGDTHLTLVMNAREPLAGSLPQRLPLIVAVIGTLLTLGAAALTLRLIHRRRDAENLADRLERVAGENQRLYAQQRTIAQTLQHALLPEQLPQIPGAETSGRYEPGEPGVEVGGDWYDVIPLDDRKTLIVVGDVSGRGLRAATTMASLRYAIHAYAAQNDPPATILSKLSRLLNVTQSGQLATVLCTLIDIDARALTVTSAGHLPPLLISDNQGRYLESEVGLPIGVEDRASYESTTVSAPPRATFIAFTDGLVERRGEDLDQGLARLREAATTNHAALPDLLSRLIGELRQGPFQDDTAIVGLRWRS
jgi:serine phosphatase RsbU (regulator of sigma subunit)